MPIKVAVENSDELRLIVYVFSGDIDPAGVIVAVTHAVGKLAPHQAYRELLIFQRDTDLSDFDPETLARLCRTLDELVRKHKLGSRTSAAVLDGSIDAKLIMPLFNALTLVGGGVDLRFELFAEVEPALKWLSIPPEEGLKCVARAA